MGIYTHMWTQTDIICIPTDTHTHMRTSRQAPAHTSACPRTLAHNTQASACTRALMHISSHTCTHACTHRPMAAAPPSALYMECWDFTFPRHPLQWPCLSMEPYLRRQGRRMGQSLPLAPGTWPPFQVQLLRSWVPDPTHSHPLSSCLSFSLASHPRTSTHAVP